MNEIIKDSPPVTLVGLYFLGISINEWVAILGIIYTIFLLIDKFPTVVERIKQFLTFVKWMKVKKKKDEVKNDTTF